MHNPGFQKGGHNPLRILYPGHGSRCPPARPYTHMNLASVACKGQTRRPQAAPHREATHRSRVRPRDSEADLLTHQDPGHRPFKSHRATDVAQRAIEAMHTVPMDALTWRLHLKHHCLRRHLLASLESLAGVEQLGKWIAWTDNILDNPAQGRSPARPITAAMVLEWASSVPDLPEFFVTLASALVSALDKDCASVEVLSDVFSRLLRILRALVRLPGAHVPPSLQDLLASVASTRGGFAQEATAMTLCRLADCSLRPGAACTTVIDTRGTAAVFARLCTEVHGPWKLSGCRHLLLTCMGAPTSVMQSWCIQTDLLPRLWLGLLQDDGLSTASPGARALLTLVESQLSRHPQLLDACSRFESGLVLRIAAGLAAARAPGADGKTGAGTKPDSSLPFTLACATLVLCRDTPMLDRELEVLDPRKAVHHLLERLLNPAETLETAARVARVLHLLCKGNPGAIFLAQTNPILLQCLCSVVGMRAATRFSPFMEPLTLALRADILGSLFATAAVAVGGHGDTLPSAKAALVLVCSGILTQCMAAMGMSDALDTCAMALLHAIAAVSCRIPFPHGVTGQPDRDCGSPDGGEGSACALVHVPKRRGPRALPEHSCGWPTVTTELLQKQALHTGMAAVGVQAFLARQIVQRVMVRPPDGSPHGTSVHLTALFALRALRHTLPLDPRGGVVTHPLLLALCHFSTAGEHAAGDLCKEARAILAAVPGLHGRDVAAQRRFLVDAALLPLKHEPGTACRLCSTSKDAAPCVRFRYKEDLIVAHVECVDRCLSQGHTTLTASIMPQFLSGLHRVLEMELASRRMLEREGPSTSPHFHLSPFLSV